MNFGQNSLTFYLFSIGFFTIIVKYKIVFYNEPLFIITKFPEWIISCTR